MLHHLSVAHASSSFVVGVQGVGSVGGGILVPKLAVHGVWPTGVVSAAAAVTKPNALCVCAGSGLPMCKTVVEDTWNKIFIGGLPCHYTDEQVCGTHTVFCEAALILLRMRLLVHYVVA